MVLINMLVIFIVVKIFKFSLEEVIFVFNVNIGGFIIVVVMVILKGWFKLVGLIFIVGIFGYIVGNYFGFLVGNILI